MKRILFISLSVIIILSAVVLSLIQKQAPAETNKTTLPIVKSPVSYKDVTYTVEGQGVTLKDGVSEIDVAPDSSSKIVTRYFGNEAKGDLNGDGTEDVAFLITHEGGGSGTFYYVVVALKSDKEYAGTNAVLLGDRIAPQSTEIRNGTVIVNYAERLADEPVTAKPSVGRTKYLIVRGSELVETPIFIESPKNGATISSPLTVNGVAQGSWYFEASFPLVLKDSNGKVIAESHASSQGDWMIADYVAFSGTLTFAKQAAGSEGALILRKDNPSGLPEHDDSREIPVRF